MNLIELVTNIENVDEEAIIFQESKDDFNSDIILSYAEEGDEGIKEERGRKYYYLIEVFLAKEFIEDWKSNLDYQPTFEEIAQRLHEYGINDA